MINFLKSKKVYKNIAICLFVAYSICTLFNQQVKLASYENEQKYYQNQITELNKQKEDLVATKENVDSYEYIENVAREKLDMYLPTETIFIDVSK